MKSQTAWIIGVFVLGLGLGSYFLGSAVLATNEPGDIEAALQDAPVVDCGDGREAVYVPVTGEVGTSFRVRCVPAEGPPARAEAAAVVAPRTSEPAPVVKSEAPRPSESAPRSADVERDDERSWKERAVIIGGAAGTGAGIGAIAKGKKGAVVGAAIGAASATAYELIKKDQQKN